MTHTQILFATHTEYSKTKDEYYFNLDQEYYLIYRDQEFYVLTGCLDNMSQEDLDQMKLEDQWNHPEKDQGISFIICEGEQFEVVVGIMNSIFAPLSYRMIEEIAKFCSKNLDRIQIIEEGTRQFCIREE